MAWIGPPDGWQPRPYQAKAWNKWVNQDCKHLELIWHRRAGKDEMTLYGTCLKADRRPANYWHLLPLQNQARKAIWSAVNPHTGQRRIDEAFPHSLRAATLDNEMMIKFKNGSTWQCLGSDTYQNHIGSSPAGIVYSEWSQSNPSARGYLRPILRENDGWQLYITTPRGKNHAYSTFNAAKKNPNSFAQRLTIHDTGVLTPEQLKEELLEYVSTYGEDMGLALYAQEYECSFDAAILGAFYGNELTRIDREGRICDVPHNPEFPVHAAFDIGRTDDTSIWLFQVYGNEIHFLESYSTSGRDPDHFISWLMGKHVTIDIITDEQDKKIVVTIGGDLDGAEHRQAYRYGSINLPHDAKAKTFAAQGKSVEEQFAKAFGWGKVQIVPNLSFQDGIQATRKMLNRSVFDECCDSEIEAVRQYHREWDDDKKKFKDSHFHDWTSHPSDALRYAAVAWNEDKLPKELKEPKWGLDRNFKEMLELNKKRRLKAEEY